MTDPTTAALAAGLISPNELDRNLEPANIVDGLYAIVPAVEHLADVIMERSTTA
jgi:hypothetical protein